MSDIKTYHNDGLKYAKQLAEEEEEGIGRKPKGATGYIIPAIAVI